MKSVRSKNKKTKDLKSENLKTWKDHWERTTSTSASFKDAFFLMDQIKMEYLLPLLPNRGKRTLEVGAGSGRLSRFLALKGYDTYCLDYSIDALTYARSCYEKEGAKGVYVLGRAEHLPFKDNSIDVVFSTGLLEHFEDPMPIICEMVRVLRKGGLFYSDIVSKKFRLLTSSDFIRPLLGREWNPLFEMPFAKKDIIGFLQASNLRNVTVFPAAVFPPRAPILRGYRLLPLCESIIAQALTPLLKHLDGTIIAKYLGFYYFAYGYK